MSLSAMVAVCLAQSRVTGAVRLSIENWFVFTEIFTVQDPDTVSNGSAAMLPGFTMSKLAVNVFGSTI